MGWKPLSQFLDELFGSKHKICCILGGRKATPHAFALQYSSWIPRLHSCQIWQAEDHFIMMAELSFLLDDDRLRLLAAALPCSASQWSPAMPQSCELRQEI